MPESLTVTELTVSYQFDRDDFQKLRKVDFFEEKTGMKYSSLRSEYDERGFPRKWVVKQQSARNAPEDEKEFKFKEIGSFTESEEWNIFAPVSPENYIVGELRGEGRSRIISNPENGDLLTVPGRPFGGFRRFIAKFIVALTFLVPLGYLFNVYRKDRDNS